MGVGEFQMRFEELLSDGLLEKLVPDDAHRVSAFMQFLDLYDPSAAAKSTMFRRMIATVRSTNAEKCYPSEMILKEALHLERYLRGRDSRLRQILRWWNPLR